MQAAKERPRRKRENESGENIQHPTSNIQHPMVANGAWLREGTLALTPALSPRRGGMVRRRTAVPLPVTAVVERSFAKR
jgi:hypothetical protein